MIRGSRSLALLLLLALPPLVCGADEPVRTVQLVWSVLAFNGADYSGTFAPETSPTVWLMAGVDNVVSLRKTLVYWWPATSAWMTDTEALDLLMPGTLEVRLAGRDSHVQRLAMQSYTYFNVKGEYEHNWKVVVGEAAAHEIRRSETATADYRTAMADYRRAADAYEQEVARLSGQAEQARGRGENPAALAAQIGALQRPSVPALPSDYAVPPVGIQQAFIVNLPQGNYNARLINADGSILQGSERRLVVWSPERTRGIGYEVIPADRWTRPVESTVPSSVLYVDGTADLYLQPFFEDEVNDLAYERTIDNVSRANENLVKWVRTQLVPRARIQLMRSRTGRETLDERAYVIEQVEGAYLGYRIVPYDPQGAHRDQTPNLKAFLVPTRNASGVLRFQTLDDHGTPMVGSERHVRIVHGVVAGPLLAGLALLPLAAMAAVLVTRSRRYHR